MDKKLKKKWVKALRSGQYQQTHGQLRTEEGYCCLGVLCDVMDPTQWKGKKDHFKWDGALLLLPSDKVLSGNDQTILSNKNDEYESFGMIADWIEENL